MPCDNNLRKVNSLPELQAAYSPAPKRRRDQPRLRDDTAALVERSADAIIREPECRELTRLSRMTRYRLERDGLFPKKRKLGPRATGWLRSEIQAWIAERAAI
jgi:prophage regulatory protein